MSHSKLIISAKIAVSVIVLLALMSRVEITQLLRRLNDVDLFYFLISVIFSILAVIIVGYRWYLVMAGMQISFSLAMRATFAGLFVGQILPGAVGVDVVRGWMVWNMGINNKSLLASLIIDRLISLFAVALMIAAGLPFLVPYLPQWMHSLVWLFLFGGILCITLGYFSINLIRPTTVGQAFERLITRLGLKDLTLSKSVLTKALGLAVLTHVSIIISAFFMGRAIGIDSAFFMWALLMPIIILITAIPISINGWGVREMAMIYLWGLFAVKESDAFLTSVCLGLVAILSSLPGVWFWIKRKTHNH